MMWIWMWNILRVLQNLYLTRCGDGWMVWTDDGWRDL